MKIEEARKLQVGDTVQYPADRGDPAGSGEVTHIGRTEQTNQSGEIYQWISVKGRHHESVWPSNRLALVSPTSRRKP